VTARSARNTAKSGGAHTQGQENEKEETTGRGTEGDSGRQCADKNCIQAPSAKRLVDEKYVTSI